MKNNYTIKDSITETQNVKFIIDDSESFEKINEIEFTLPFKVDRIVNGLVDSNQVSISITDNSSFKVNFENSSEVLDNRVIYLGKVFHEKLDYNQSPS